MTGEFIDPELTENLMHSITIGEEVCSEFKSSRLDKKPLSCLTRSQQTKVAMKSAELQKTPDINKKTLAFMRTIDITGLKP